MMKYPHIMAALTEERWAIEQSKLQMILDFMADQSAGLKYDSAEIAARTGGSSRSSDGATKAGSIAILPLRGVISNRISMMNDISGGTSSEAFAAAFKALIADKSVKAIVIDVDSPGGAVSGTDELSSLIYASRGVKPIVAHVNSTAASAAYWVASAADEIVVTPSGAVGSIGVLYIHDDMSGALEKAGIRKTIISAGERKTSGNSFSALPDDVRARIQSRINVAYESFVRAVSRNRGVDAQIVRESFGRGEMVDAPEAVGLQMADRLGTLDETLIRLKQNDFKVSARPRRAAPVRDRYARELRSEMLASMRRDIDEPPVVMRLTGLATLFDQVAYITGHGLTEYLASCYRELPDVPLVRDHDLSAQLTKLRSVKLKKSSRGLVMSCDICADRFGLAAVETYLAGYRLMSVGTDIQASTRIMIGGKAVKSVSRARVLEVSLVREAAFRGTEATLEPVDGRSMSQAIDFLRKQAHANA